MGVYQLIRTQRIHASMEEVWAFISKPQNLKQITPPSMGFDILSDATGDMYEGQIIKYRVKPMLNIPTIWVTEITHVKYLQFFVDEQRVGPYKMWHHEHHIEECEEGVLMKDIITYQPPFGFIGSLMNTLVIGKKLNEIFEFRTKAINTVFPPKS